MGRFRSASDVKVIQADWWDEDETVTIRRFGYGDRQYLSGKTMQARLSPQGLQEAQKGELAGLDMEMSIEEMNLAVLERGIVRWTLQRDDESDVVAPLNRAWIEKLTEEDAEFILAEINAFNPSQRRTEEEQASFRGGAGDGAAEG